MSCILNITYCILDMLKYIVYITQYILYSIYHIRYYKPCAMHIILYDVSCCYNIEWYMVFRSIAAILYFTVPCCDIRFHFPLVKLSYMISHFYTIGTICIISLIPYHNISYAWISYYVLPGVFISYSWVTQLPPSILPPLGFTLMNLLWG